MITHEGEGTLTIELDRKTDSIEISISSDGGETRFGVARLEAVKWLGERLLSSYYTLAAQDEKPN